MKEISDIINCPFCKFQLAVKLDLDLKVQKVVCSNPKCQREFNIPIKFKRVYLSRTFECSDTKYKFPVHVRKNFDGIIETVDPWELYKEQKPSDDIISFVNKQWLDSCDIYVGYIFNPSFGTLGELYYAKSKPMPVYIFNPSFGTLGELYYAKSKPMPVYIINPNRVWTNNIWLRYHTNKVFDDIDTCFYYILSDIVYDYNLKIQGE